ncbi:PD-(D/E)XK nuclease family protein [Yeosuana sp.]|uniref:PD-(D/E)XK nuclease family protein n=1 Tax=Yeosuana sp. TaxID=2529388 RepID=UPI004054EDF4
MKNFNKEEIENKILDVIESQNFKEKLNFINYNYPNLKQENLIRNEILERLNEYFIFHKLSHLKAFAEHPRENNNRVDLSIVHTQEGKEGKPFLRIEFKFQFSNDCQQLKNYKGVIEKDFNGKRNSDMFILIVSNWKKKDKLGFDVKWGELPNLSKYISEKDDWKANILKTLNEFETDELALFDNQQNFKKIEITKPYPTEYYFYILRRLY